MQEQLTFRTTYLDDSFKIWEGENSFSKLYKSSWMGWTIDVKVDNKYYQIIREGIWYPRIKIVDKKTSREVANARVRIPFFSITPSVVTKFDDGQVFEWRQNGFLNRSWTWVENDNVVIQSQENTDLFSLSGEITMLNENKHNNLLSILGLYLRSSIASQNRLGQILALGYLILTILRLTLA